jgi:SAM-dependent methyltransferase
MHRLSAALVLACLVTLMLAQSARAAEAPSRYEFRENHSRDGIGKFYLGREIAHVMGHQAADWLERPEREAEERTSKLLELLAVRPGQIVADIGCGTGYIARRLAMAAGPTGRIYGVDIQPEMLVLLTNRLSKEGLTNVVPVLGTIKDPKLPANSVDLVVMVDVYHEFDHPFEMIESTVRALKPNGRIAFVEFRGEDPAVPIKELHKMTAAQVRKEMAPHPLEWIETLGGLPWQHVILFRKTSPKQQ